MGGCGGGSVWLVAVGVVWTACGVIRLTGEEVRLPGLSGDLHIGHGIMLLSRVFRLQTAFEPTKCIAPTSRAGCDAQASW